MDKVFNALAASSRRKILDIVKNNPGINVNKLTEYFEFSRYAVMKHLRILEDAELIVSKRSSRIKALYVNAIPIQTIYDRWISQFSALWATKLSHLKYQLEKENHIMVQTDIKHVFITYIKTTKEKLWDALINPELTEKYYFGSRLRSELTPGSTIELVAPDKEGNESIHVSGMIEEVVPLERLVYSFALAGNDDTHSRVTYSIEETEMGLKLTLLHDNFEGETETYKGIIWDWPVIISGLKTLLETGKTL